MNLDFWRDKRVLVTGHTGFKGTWMSLALEALGAEVLGVSADENSTRILWNSTKEDLKIDSYIFDICDEELLFNIIDRERPEIIFHFAAQPLVREAFTNPFETVRSNVLGTMSILESVIQFESIRTTIAITSDKVYHPNKIGRPYIESDQLGGKEIYSASKASVEILVGAFCNSYRNQLTARNQGIATARAGNVFGGGDGSPNRLVPDIFRSLKRHEGLKLRHPLSTRPWQHIFDVVNGYLLLAEKLYLKPSEFSSSWNFSNPKLNMTVEQLVGLFESMLRKKYSINLKLEMDRNRDLEFYETEFLDISSEKANSLLGWRPLMSESEALQNTTEWYVLYNQGVSNYELAQLSRNSINEFLERI